MVNGIWTKSWASLIFTDSQVKTPSDLCRLDVTRVQPKLLMCTWVPKSHCQSKGVRKQAPSPEGGIPQRA